MKYCWFSLRDYIYIYTHTHTHVYVSTYHYKKCFSEIKCSNTGQYSKIKAKINYFFKYMKLLRGRPYDMMAKEPYKVSEFKPQLHNYIHF